MPYRALFKHNDFFNRIVIVGYKTTPLILTKWIKKGAYPMGTSNCNTFLNIFT